MAIRVKVEGKGEAVFPDGTPDDVIQRAVRREFFGEHSVADDARQRLHDRGLTPQDVKAGHGITSPDDITFAPAKEMNGGFLGGFASALNPLNAMDAMLNATQKMTVMGGAPPSGMDAMRTAGQAVGVPDIAGTAEEAYRRGAANQSTSDMYGGVAGVAATAAAMKAAPMVAKNLMPSAVKQYTNVVDPSGANPAAAEVAQEMLDKNMTMRDPRAEIANYAEQQAQGADRQITAAVKKMAPVNAEKISAAIQRIKAGLYNPETGAPLRPDSDAIAAKLDAYAANHILGNAKTSLGPNGEVVFQMDPEVARELKGNFDMKKYGRGSETGEAEAQGGVGDAIRQEMNADPDVAAANAQATKYLNIKNDVAPKAAKDTIPTAKRIAGAATRTAVAEGIGAVVPGVRGAAHIATAAMGLPSIASIVIDTVRSPLWKTTSAVMKAKLARAIASGDTSQVSAVSRAILASEVGHKQ